MENRTVKIPVEGADKIIESKNCFVIVGANGSGKSHLGAWIEEHNPNTLRVSAQRALTIPERINIKSEESSLDKIFWGSEDRAQRGNRGYKWQWGKVTSTLVNDYENVLSAVFAKESNQLRDFKKKYSLSPEGLDSFKTITEQINEIWNTVFPHRDLILSDFQVFGEYQKSRYFAGEMSDGERVCLYLIAQCLIAPSGSIIIIDEPEIHLHTSIMKSLWDVVEGQCTDKTLVYITHNLDFAASRNEATKIWVQSYNGKDTWELSILQNNEDIPDRLFYEVLGSRKPILFIEGETNSYDDRIYNMVYENYHVIPYHNCSKVISLTKAFNDSSVRKMHNYAVKGIIDHDFLSTEEIEGYKKDNIFTLNVSEIENLFLSEELIKLMAKHLGSNEEDVFTRVKDVLFKCFVSEKGRIVSSIFTKEIRHILNKLSYPDNNDKDSVCRHFSSFIGGINITSVYDTISKEIDDIIEQQDYKRLIMLYNNKDLCKKVEKPLGLSKSYVDTVLCLMRTDKGPEIINCLKPYLPSIE